MGNFCVFNLQKNHKSDLPGKAAEVNRTSKDYVCDVDLTRSNENIILKKSDNWLRSIYEICADNEVKRKISDKAVMAFTMVYTASPEWFEAHTKEEALSYFKACCEWEERHLGVSFSQIIHMDEGTPHLQTATVPITHDGRLSARDFTGGQRKEAKLKMKDLQTSFYEEVGKKFGMEKGVSTVNEFGENINTPKKRISEAEYQLSKTETLVKEKEKELRDVQAELIKARKMIKDISAFNDAYEEVERMREVGKGRSR